MHAANNCAKNYANGKNLQVDTTRRAHPPTANRAYQQLSPAACLFAACVPLVCRPYSLRPPPALWLRPTSQHITVDGLYCTPTENLSRFCKIFTIFRINCFPVWNN